jgi:hypothetical protein
MQRNILFGIVGLAYRTYYRFLCRELDQPSGRSKCIVDNNSSLRPAPEAPGQSSGGMLADVDQMIQTAESEPQNFVAQMRTGDMYAKIGKFDSAIEFYKRGILLKPDDFQRKCGACQCTL